MFARLALVAALLIPASPAVVAHETQYRTTTAAADSQARAEAFPHVERSSTQAVYDYDGRYLGADPDPFIRLQLLRDRQSSRGGN